MKTDIQNSQSWFFSGKLDFPNEELLYLSLHLYSHYKSVKHKSNITPVKSFEKIYMFTLLKLLRCLNCFSKDFAAKESENLKKKEHKKSIKKLKMSNKTCSNVIFYNVSATTTL